MSQLAAFAGGGFGRDKHITAELSDHYGGEFAILAGDGNLYGLIGADGDRFAKLHCVPRRAFLHAAESTLYAAPCEGVTV